MVIVQYECFTVSWNQHSTFCIGFMLKLFKLYSTFPATDQSNQFFLPVHFVFIVFPPKGWSRSVSGSGSRNTGFLRESAGRIWRRWRALGVLSHGICSWLCLLLWDLSCFVTLLRGDWWLDQVLKALNVIYQGLTRIHFRMFFSIRKLPWYQRVFWTFFEQGCDFSAFLFISLFSDLKYDPLLLILLSFWNTIFFYFIVQYYYNSILQQ